MSPSQSSASGRGARTSPMSEMTDPVAVAERELAEALNRLLIAETKAAAEGRIVAPDEINKKAREVEWRIAVLRILKEGGEK